MLFVVVAVVHCCLLSIVVIKVTLVCVGVVVVQVILSCHDFYDCYHGVRSGTCS